MLQSQWNCNIRSNLRWDKSYSPKVRLTKITASFILNSRSFSCFSFVIFVLLFCLFLFLFKGALSGLRQFLGTGRPSEMMGND